MRGLQTNGWAAGAWLLAAATAAADARADTVEYRLDPAHTFVHFEVRHFGTSTIRGRLGPISGSVTLDRVEGRGRLAVTVDTAGVSTGLRVFDSRLREPDLLDSAGFAQASFTAGDFRFKSDQLVEVRGELELRGVRRPLTLRALRFACEQRELLQREVCGGDFEAEVERSAYGMSFGVPFVADRVRLVVQVEGIRAE